LQQIEEQVYEIVPVRDAEIRGTYCAARKMQLKRLRETIRQKLIQREQQKMMSAHDDLAA
jgi:hypothetical protein